jgi:succinate dehydrogenase/fumarate reductase cytochrome b subunit
MGKWRRACSGGPQPHSASGGPAGLLLSASYFLIPYYPLAVIAVFTHIGLGIRIVLLGHRIQPAIAARAAYAVSTLGAVVAVVIATALFGVHVVR